MRLFFQHLAGRITHFDWQYATMLATFDELEEQSALETGWLPHEYEPPFWFQGRQVRYDLSALKNSKKHKIPKRIKYEFTKNVDFTRYQDIWSSYLAAKGFDDTQPIEQLFDIEPGKKQILEIYDYDELVAFSVIRMEPAPISLQFAWNYHEPKLSLGSHTQYFEMMYLESIGEDYSYVCPGYEKTCIWKARFPGFEFWTGMEWSKDKNLYTKLCERDSDLIELDELAKENLLPLVKNWKKGHNW